MSAEKILLEECLADLGIDKLQFYGLKETKEKDKLLQKQYKILALQVHPDKVRTEEKPVATEKFKKLASAYETAKNLHPQVKAQGTTAYLSFFSPLSRPVLSDEQIRAIFYSVLDENERKIEIVHEKFIKSNQSLDEQYNTESNKIWEAQFAQYKANSKNYYQIYQNKCYEDYVDEAYQRYQQAFTDRIEDSKVQITSDYQKKLM